MPSEPNMGVSCFKPLYGVRERFPNILVNLMYPEVFARKEVIC
jgi:hypothetical protein